MPLSVLAQLINLRTWLFPQAGQHKRVSSSPANISLSKQWPQASHLYSWIGMAISLTLFSPGSH
jgi:hypothetical protein